MKLYKILACTILSLQLFSCGEKNSDNSSEFSLNITHENEKIKANQPFNISIKNKNKRTIDSVQYYYTNKKIAAANKNNPTTLKISSPLGKNKISATVFSEGESIVISDQLIIHAAQSPKVYTYKIINTYPHDKMAFTQGLEFYNDTLYEGTGRNGQSSLRKVDYKTGEVLQKINLNKAYFGEGITIMNNKIYQLTWRSGDGFVYDLDSFEKLKTFTYNKSKEGWGLCNDGKKLYKSDGTEKIWILNPETLAEESYIQPVTQTSLSTRLNELEWVEGKIYANTWQKDGIAIINPKSGVIEGIIDFRGLRKKLSNSQNLMAEENVLNGIAYNASTKKLYVTGKNWDKLFEVEIIEKP